MVPATEAPERLSGGHTGARLIGLGSWPRQLLATVAAALSAAAQSMEARYRTFRGNISHRDAAMRRNHLAPRKGCSKCQNRRLVRHVERRARPWTSSLRIRLRQTPTAARRIDAQTQGRA